MNSPILLEAGLKWVNAKIASGQLVDSMPFDHVENDVKVADGVAKITVTYFYENQPMWEMPMAIVNRQGIVVLRGVTGSIGISVGQPDKE